MTNIVREALLESRAALDRLIENSEMQARIEKAGLVFASAFENKGRAYSCGNGGSTCDAMHFAEELTGRFRRDRRPLPGQAIADAGHLTCTSNDFGYEEVFSRYIEAHGREGDVLLAISTSGKSENVIRAIKSAKKIGVKTIGLTGKENSPMSGLVDIEICTPGGRFADRVQELHIKVVHILMEVIERKMFPGLY